MSVQCKLLPFTNTMFIDRSKFHEQFLKRVIHSMNISMKLFKNLTSSFREEVFYEFVHVRIVKVAPIHQSHVYERIKILLTIFEEGTFLTEHFCELGIRSHLLCCACRLDLATELSG